MGIKSKRKGNRFERRCASLLAEFTGEPFRRIPSSGAFNKFGGVKVAEYVFSGDTICDRAGLQFSIEAKNQKVFSFIALLKDPNKAAFSQWWRQCVEDAVSVKRLPMLMFKPDTQEDFVGITEEGRVLLEIPKYVPHFNLDVYGCRNDCRYCATDSIDTCKWHASPLHGVQLPPPKIFRWKTFVSVANPEKMFGGDDGVLREIKCEENPTDSESGGEGCGEERAE
jgi:hypothetical protein